MFEVKKQKRGFATMPKEQVIKIARMGGIAGHLKGTAHEWTSEEAIKAGRKGGQVSHGGRGRDWKD